MEDFYSKNQTSREYDKARLYLSIFSAEQLALIVGLVNYRGMGVISDIKNAPKSKFAIPPFMAMCTPELVPDEDIAPMVMGVAAICISAVRTPNWGTDQYENILMTTFGIDEAMAGEFLKKIETRDPATKEVSSWVRSIYDRANRVMLDSWNWVLRTINPNWEFDTNQGNDVDFLYEVKQLGLACSELLGRSYLIESTARLFGPSPSTPEGDINESEEDKADREVGEILGAAGLRVPQPVVLGPWSSAITKAKDAAMKSVAKVARDAGLTAESPPLHVTGQDAMRASAMKRVKSGRKSKPFIKGFLKRSPAGMMINTLGKLGGAQRKRGDIGLEEGDIDNFYDTIATEHGLETANAWASGDIDNIVKHGIIDATHNVSTGDPDLDSQIEMNSIDGDLADDESLNPEAGGLFARFKANRQKKRYAKAALKKRKQTGKFKRKMETKKVAQRYKDARRGLNVDADYGQDYDYGNDDSGYQDTDYSEPIRGQEEDVYEDTVYEDEDTGTPDFMFNDNYPG